MNLDDVRVGLTFDDVLLVPRRSSIRSRQGVSVATRLSRNAFMTTVNDDKAIAAPANIGDIRMPDTG